MIFFDLYGWIHELFLTICLFEATYCPTGIHIFPCVVYCDICRQAGRKTNASHSTYYSREHSLLVLLRLNRLDRFCLTARDVKPQMKPNESELCSLIIGLIGVNNVTATLLVSHTMVVALPGSFSAHDGVFIHVCVYGTSPGEHSTLMLYALTCAEHQGK